MNLYLNVTMFYYFFLCQALPGSSKHDACLPVRVGSLWEQVFAWGEPIEKGSAYNPFHTEKGR